MANPEDAISAPKAGVNETTRRRFRVWRLLVVAILTYLGVCGLIRLLQSRLIYFPTRAYDATPKDLGLEFEDLTLTTDDGVAIAAWYVPCAEAKASLIFCHGNAGNISDRLESVAVFHRAGYNVLLFDYRGYGRSEGRPTEDGTYRDAEAAWAFLVNDKGQSSDRIVVFGRSLGGAVAIDLAKRRRPAALVVESSFTSLLDIGRLHYPLLPVRWLLSYRYDSLGKVPHIRCPKLFIHGVEDSLIPLANGRALFAAAAEPKEFLETPGGHNTGGFIQSPAYIARLTAFLDRALHGGIH